MALQNFLNLSLLIVEDNEQARKELNEVLSLYFQKIIFAINGCDGVEKIKYHKPDIIISDIKMPCLDGIEMIKKTKTSSYKPIIIYATAFSDRGYLLDALDIKVDAYLVKPINISLLLKKIEESLESERWRDVRYKKLSQREFEVFLDIARGIKPAQIAQKYNIKPKTISTYRNRIFEKMGFTNNAELISYALKNGLIEYSPS